MQKVLFSLLIVLWLAANSLALESLPTPEDFGAKGDGATDDSIALDKFFNSWKPTNLYQSVSLALTPGKTYVYTKPLVVTCGTVGVNFRLSFNGNGSRLLYTGGLEQGYAFRLGDWEGKKKGFYCAVRDVAFAVDSKGADGNVLLDYSDFALLENVVCSSGTKVLGANLKVNHHNSLTLINVSTVGADRGALFSDTTNVLNWMGGKVQQCRIGIQYTGSVFRLDGIDLSIIQECGVSLSRASSGEVRCYTELIGPGTRNNDAACVRVEGCEGIVIGGFLNCASKTISSATHAGYGVDVKDSYDVIVRANAYLPQREYVRANTNCRNIDVQGVSEAVTVYNFPTAQPIKNYNRRVLTSRKAIQLQSKTTGGGSLLPAVENWTSNGEASKTNESQPDYAGTGEATVLNLPKVGPVSRFDSPIVSVPPGKYELQARLRLVRFNEPDVLKRNTDLAIVYMQLRIDDKDPQTKDKDLRYPRIGESWQDVWVQLDAPNGGQLRAFFGTVSNYEPMTVAVDFLRVVKVK